MKTRRITIITTGGTIEKVYDERSGALVNRRSIVRRMLSRLRLEDADVNIVELMSKDSLHLTPADREKIVAAVRTFSSASEGTEIGGVVVLHGTDTLSVTGEDIHSRISDLKMPVVLTGAIRPFSMRRSDALQNLTEAMLSTSFLPPGVYCVAHGRVLEFPGVTKDIEKQTFVKE